MKLQSARNRSLLVLILCLVYLTTHSSAFGEECRFGNECQTANQTCNFDKEKCECPLGFVQNGTKQCLQLNCTLSGCSQFGSTHCLNGECRCDDTKGYILNQNSNSCIRPPVSDNRLTIIVLSGVGGGVLVAVAIIVVWQYINRRKKANTKKAYMFQAFAEAMQAAARQPAPAANTNTNSNAGQEVALEAYPGGPHSPQSQPISSMHQSNYTAPLDFPPPYSAVDYGEAGPSSTADLDTHQQSGSGQTSSNPFSPIAPSKMTLL